MSAHEGQSGGPERLEQRGPAGGYDWFPSDGLEPEEPMDYSPIRPTITDEMIEAAARRLDVLTNGKRRAGSKPVLEHWRRYAREAFQAAGFPVAPAPVASDLGQTTEGGEA